MAIKETVQIDVETNADKTADDLTSAVRDLQKAIEAMTGSMNDGFSEANNNINKVDEGVQDIGTSAKNSEKGVKTLSTGFRGMGAAMKAAGIGLVIEGLNILKKLLGENQVVVDAFNTAFEFVSIAFNDFVNFILANSEAVTGFFKGIFEDPKQALLDFADAFKRNIQERFESYLDTLGYLASAVKKVFSGDFAGALEDVKSAGKESLDVLTGVNNTFDKGKEAISKVATATKDYVVQTGKAAKETVELNKQAELSDAIRQGLLEKYDLEAEKLRQVRDDERVTISERIKANEDLGAVLDKQEKEMMAAANLRLVAAEREAAKKKGNLEAEKALIEARNEVAGVEAQIAGLRSEQLTNEASLQRELVEIENGKKEAAIEANEIEKQAAIEKEIDVLKRLQLEKELAEETKVARLDIIESELASVKEGTARYQELLNEKLLLEKEAAAESKRIERETEEEKLRIREESNKAVFAMTMQGLEAVSALTEAFAGQSEAQQRRAFQVQKALSAASTVMSTIEGAQSAFTTANKSPITAVFPAYPYIQAGLATAFGIAKLQQIRTQQFSPDGSPSPPSTSTGAPASATSARSFSPDVNVVGASGVNVLAESISGRPVKAYVVGGDVSTQQELDRKRVKNATV
jgi:hypothetical protein